MSEAYDFSSESAYDYVRRMINAHQAKETPRDVPLARRAYIRQYCCDTGPLSVESFETALAALDEQDAIALGEQYVARPETRAMATDAIEWVAEQDAVDKQFVAAVNALEVDG